MLTRSIRALGVATLCAMLYPAAPQAETTIESARADGVVIGFANFRPYSFVTDDGTVRGESVDVVTAVLAKIGVTDITPVPSEFSALIPSLQVGRVDMLASGMSVRPARCNEVAFSLPYLSIAEALVVPKDNPNGLTSYEDIVAQDATLGIIAGGAQLKYAEAAGISDDKISQLPDLPTALAALRSGRIDALALSSLSAAGVVEQVAAGANDIERTPPITMVGGQSVVSHIAFAVNKDDVAFLETFDAALADFVGSEEHLEIIAAYGLTAADLPTMTLEELCAE